MGKPQCNPSSIPFLNSQEFCKLGPLCTFHFHRFTTRRDGSVFNFTLYCDDPITGKEVNCCLHCKKGLPFFPSPAGGMSLTKPSLDGNNLIIPFQWQSRVSDIPARLGTGKIIKKIYSVHFLLYNRIQSQYISVFHLVISNGKKRL